MYSVYNLLELEATFMIQHVTLQNHAMLGTVTLGDATAMTPL